MIASAQPAMDARRSRGADTTRREMLAFVAALSFLAILPSSLALQCKCNNKFPLSDCRFDGWICTVPDNIGACLTRIRIHNGTVLTEYDCVFVSLNPILCSGAYNSNTSVYECCTDRNFCNEGLSPTFPPSSDSTSTSTNTVTSIAPSQTTSATSSPSSSVTVSTSSATSSVTVSTSSAIGPTPLPGKLRCECSGDLCHGESSCDTNYKCYREVQVADYVETRLGCIDSIPAVNLDGLLACAGGLDTETKKIKCCDDGDFCNRNLSVVLNPPSPPTKDPSPPTKDPSPPTKDPSPSVGKLASSNDTSKSDGGDIYIILSIVIVLVTMLTIVITALVVLTVFFMCYQRDKVKVFSVDHFQNRKRHLSADSPYTGKGEPHPPPDTPPPDYVEHVYV